MKVGRPVKCLAQGHNKRTGYNFTYNKIRHYFWQCLDFDSFLSNLHFDVSETKSASIDIVLSTV